MRRETVDPLVVAERGLLAVGASAGDHGGEPTPGFVASIPAPGGARLRGRHRRRCARWCRTPKPRQCLGRRAHAGDLGSRLRSLCLVLWPIHPCVPSLRSPLRASQRESSQLVLKLQVLYRVYSASLRRRLAVPRSWQCAGDLQNPNANGLSPTASRDSPCPPLGSSRDPRTLSPLLPRLWAGTRGTCLALFASCGTPAESPIA